MKAASFTGHRSISGDLNALKADMYNKLERAILNGGITQFNAGGAIGFDTIAAETVIELRKNYSDITLNLVLPCSPGEQTLKWTADQKHRFYDIMNNANNVEFTSPHYYDGCMKARNLRLIELADCVCRRQNRTDTDLEPHAAGLSTAPCRSRTALYRSLTALRTY